MIFAKKYFTVFQHYIIAGIFLCLSFLSNAQDTRFTVVLDAGHGGHDPGAKGSITREKDINLAVTLILGRLIEQNFKDVRVVYTRKTDVYLTLQERANVVNDHHADLFICVHTNSSPGSSAYGAESYTLGLAKTKSNLDVAMRENSVITLEEDYKTKYHGFDPSSVDSYIMFEFMQDKYIDRSVDFASTVQKQFRSYCGRLDRGVRQAGFWVLHRSACPSVLVEVGFISNPAEEKFLYSEAGQREMATGIYNAFVDYKRTHDKKSGKQAQNVSKIEQKTKAEEVKDKTLPEKQKSETKEKNTPEKESKTVQANPKPENTKPEQTQPAKPSTKNVKPVIDTVFQAAPLKSEPTVLTTTKLPENNTDIKTEPKTTITSSVSSPSVVYKIQLFASKKALKAGCKEFKGLKNIDSFKENGFYKYTVGNETEYKKIEALRKKIIHKFPESFILGFSGDKKLTAKELSKQKK